MLTPEQQRALADIAAAAVATERSTGLPAEISAAQAILESGWLENAPRNNCFGIKAYAGCHGTQLLSTREWLTAEQHQTFVAKGEGRTAAPAQPVQRKGARQLYHVRDLFATFASLADCFAYHAKLLTKGVYAPAWSQYQRDRDLNAYIAAIARHYATAPKYAEEISKMAVTSTVAAALAAARTQERS